TLAAWIAAPTDPNTLGRYTFLKNNCATALVRFLEIGGVLPETKKPLLKGKIPIHLDRYSDRLAAAPWPALRIEGIDSILERVANTLGLKSKNLIKGKPDAWPVGSGARIAQDPGFTINDRLRLLHFATEMPAAERDAVLKTLPPVSERPALDALLGVAVAPAALYQACDTTGCAESAWKAARSLWSTESLNENLASLQQIAAKLLKKSVSPQLQNVLLLVQQSAQYEDGIQPQMKEESTK
ncbi:MAG: hypothetical protein AAB425_07430, partial [Bdellovibrionota bacterium]